MSSQCPDCEGKGFKEYDAGLVQIGCKMCEMTGKVNSELTKEEFEKAYAFRSDMTPYQVAEMGLEAAPSECLQGWAMRKKAVAAPEVEITGEIPRYYTEAERNDSDIGEILHAAALRGEVRESIVQKIGEINDNSDSGTRPDNSNLGSNNTSQPEQPKKRKSKKKAGKGTR